jgi:uncharacterized protein (TIGR03435 family)
VAVRVVLVMSFAVTLSVAGQGRAQHEARSDPSPTFTAASVERANVDETGTSFNYRAGRFTATNVTLRTLIRTAYGVPESLISGGPPWVHEDRFHVTGLGNVGPSPAPLVVQPGGPSRLQLMMQSLLANRFKLVVHTERRGANVYALRRGPAGNLGAGLRRSAVDCAVRAAEARRPTVPAQTGTRTPPLAHPCDLSRSAGSISIGGRPLSQLVSALSATLGRPVVDHTGLTGTFDIHLEWATEGSPSGGGVSPAAGIDRMITAIQEQLGLVLALQKEAVDVLVIDHAERPVAD